MSKNFRLFLFWRRAVQKCTGTAPQRRKKGNAPLEKGGFSGAAGAQGEKNLSFLKMK
jgi:hypothetical protein